MQQDNSWASQLFRELSIKKGVTPRTYIKQRRGENERELNEML
jgi:hypothetical protein